jgi:glycosyltransferase involved in cell wall biosynthesis
MTELPFAPGKPMGGTELHLLNIQNAFPDLWDQVQFIASRPEQYTLDESKPRILYLQDTANDPASQCLKDKSYRSKFNRIVFCSYKQQYEYSLFLGIPPSEGVVIKNSVPMLKPEFPKPLGDGRVRFIYTSTPHRGLEILAVAADYLAKQRQDWTLDVYSSLKLYGRDEHDKQFEKLYEFLQKNPCVTYHGSVPNAEVRQACLDAHVFVYPCIYPEMSCMAIQEAMMAGCLAITSSVGALPETCGEWAWMFPYSENRDQMVGNTYHMMNQVIDRFNEPPVQLMLQAQSAYFQNFYSFENRASQWKALLEAVIKEGPPQEKLVIY